MSNEFLPTDWVRAATLAHKILAQTISDEELDELVERTGTQPAPIVEAA